MDEKQYQEIVNKHAEAARQEIEAENKKTADQKRVEALNVELGTVSRSIDAMQKQPSRFRAELKAAAARQTEIFNELERLGVSYRGQEHWLS